MLMAFTMTLHNMPEGLAVAFSSYTKFGELMAVAIAMHNIPEGIIVAAPIYAATGSRTRAVTIATLSGLSEPLGALAALAFVKPFLTPLRLQFTLAFTGAELKSLLIDYCKTNLAGHGCHLSSSQD
jgi:zinc transporter, ZIP family